MEQGAVLRSANGRLDRKSRGLQSAEREVQGGQHLAPVAHPGFLLEQLPNDRRLAPMVVR